MHLQLKVYLLRKSVQQIRQEKDVISLKSANSNRRMDVETQYKNTQDNLLERQTKNRQQLNQMIWLRLFVFCALLVSVYASIWISMWWICAAICLTAAFLVLVKQNAALLYARKKIKTGLWIVEQEMKSLNHATTDWPDGSQYIKKGTVAFDLDIFGSFSLFHFVNRTSLKAGSNTLAADLVHTTTSQEEIHLRQESIRELSQHNKFRLEWQTNAQMVEEKKPLEDLFLADEKNYFIYVKAWPFVLVALALAALSTGAYFYFTGISTPFVLAVLVNLSVVGRYIKVINRKHKLVSGTSETLGGYKHCIKTYTSQQWKEERNKQNAETLHEADKAIHQLEKIAERFDRRMNILIAITFNALWLNDIVVSYQLEKWKQTYAAKLKSWFDAMAQIDARQSMATFAFNHSAVYPILSGKNQLSFEELAHPLMHNNKRVANSYSMQHPEKVSLITGSNMSGKSTFLRSIGLNLIMAQAGMPVCAKRFEFKPMHICSSLRQSDSLEENVSLFHAELLRLKAIRNEIKENPLTLVLLDEMLRGTNSEDKLQGSKKLIEELLNDSIIGFIATHDLALGELDNTYKGMVKNACFESRIEGNELYFDYKLQEGLARNKNATFLLKKMGIIQSNEPN